MVGGEAPGGKAFDAEIGFDLAVKLFAGAVAVVEGDGVYGRLS